MEVEGNPTSLQDGAPGQRSVIPRKPVPSAHLPAPSAASAAPHEGGLHGDDAASEISRLSSELSQHIDEAWRPSFSVDGFGGERTASIHRGSSIALVDLRTQETHQNAPRDQEEPLINGHEHDYGERGKIALESRESNWLPKALRWPYMILLFVVTLGLGLLVLGLTLRSE